MTVIYPGAKVRLLPQYKRARGRKPNVIVLHVTAGGASSPYPTFTKGAACSHIWIGYEGQIEQYLDFDWMSAADVDGGARAISIETAGAVDGSGKWTVAQQNALAEVLRWLAKRYGIPIRMASSSRPSSAGIATHRLGVDGNFPSDGVQRGRRQRAKKGLGERWSTSQGKICPGYDRQAQWPAIVRLAQTHVVTRKTKSRQGAACYRRNVVGAKNVTRVLPIGREVRIVKLRKKAWARTLKGDRIKQAKITGKRV